MSASSLAHSPSGTMIAQVWDSPNALLMMSPSILTCEDCDRLLVSP